jgi:hypothetical protein
MSWMGLVRAYAEDHATAKVYGRAPRRQSYAQDAQFYNKGHVALRNAMEKLMPEYIAKMQTEKVAKMIADLERQGYTVTKNG